MLKRLHHTAAMLAFLSACGCTLAADVNLNGIMGNKALLVIDNGRPRLFAAGETSPEGIKLVAIKGDSAVVEFDGRRETLTLGQNTRLSGGGGRSSGTQSVTLLADGRGHFVTSGSINGVSVRFLVDTGASYISMNSSEAKRLGINYTAGQQALASTANGVVPTYRVKLDEVRVGDVTLNGVDGMVHAGDTLPIMLLGMSFLNRMEMKRDGEKMTLSKRF